ncbi:MAG TPA: hypothetical protein VEP90_25170, partial [Methylomirabilota bacterium]|nr:hypothetical protein [Methylomirabilota bacterium]
LITEMLDRKDPYFKDNYNLFADSLHDALEWVWKKPVEVTTTEWQETVISQQTYADRKNEYANRLVLLPIGQVMVKTPSGEHVMETDVPKTAKEQRAALPSIRKRVLDQTIRDYCKSRHAVEEEIRKRQEPPLPPVSQHYTV